MGLPVQAGYAKRRSLGSTSIGGSASRPNQRVAATSGIWARSAASREVACNEAAGLDSVAWTALVSASPKPAESRSSKIPDSGASTLAAPSATSWADCGSELCGES